MTDKVREVAEMEKANVKFQMREGLMDKIEKEVGFLKEQIARFKSGSSINGVGLLKEQITRYKKKDDENTLDLMQNIAERIVYEVAFYRERLRVKSRCRTASIAGEVKAREEVGGELG